MLDELVHIQPPCGLQQHSGSSFSLFRLDDPIVNGQLNVLFQGSAFLAGIQASRDALENLVVGDKLAPCRLLHPTGLFLG
jgi:hypothetical protein